MNQKFEVELLEEAFNFLEKMEMKKCQEMEKSGISWQEHMEQMEMQADSKKSPITGKDVTEMEPAAGDQATEESADQ